MSKVSRDRARERAREKGLKDGNSNYLKVNGDTNFFTAKYGKMHLDLLPYMVEIENHPEVGKGNTWYQRTFYLHRNVGSSNRKFICLKTVGKKCPICEYRNSLANDPDANKDLVKSLIPSERELYNVLDRDDKEKGIQLWEVSYHNFGKFLDKELRDPDNDDALGFFELKDGKTVNVRFEKATFKGKAFPRADKISFDERKNYKDVVIDKVITLDDLLVVLPYEDLKRAFQEFDDDVGDVGDNSGSHTPASGNDDYEDVGASEEKDGGDNTAYEYEDDGDGKSEGSVAEYEDDGGADVAEKQDADLFEEDEKTEEKVAEPDKKKVVTGKCPAGGVFGRDLEKLKECKECDVWDECMYTKDKHETARRKENRDKKVQVHAETE